jgi:hypothetical protein
MSNAIEKFLGNYDDTIRKRTDRLRNFILKQIPGIQEELDLSARIIGYGFGKKYSDSICTIIPSKKGLKLGFYKGTELFDPQKLLEGTGKVHKYVVIEDERIKDPALKELLQNAYAAYLVRKK